MGKLLIIGNGFDLDLGWSTRYSDFARSPEWKSLKNFSKLWRRLDDAAQREKWLDLEMELFGYAVDAAGRYSFVTEDDIPRDRETYLKLCGALSDYLVRATAEVINSDSVAARILSGLLTEGKLDCIYTFNYTSLGSVISSLKVSKFSTPIVQVHGSIADRSLILGIHDTTDVDHRYNFMIKSYSEHFKSNRLTVDLAKADEIVFLGLSMGAVDNLYFEHFFHYLQNEDIEFTSKKVIRIVTYDMNSHRQILDNINTMNGSRAADLYQRTDFGFIHTSKGESDLNFIDYMKHIAPKVENLPISQSGGDNRALDSKNNEVLAV